MNPLPPVNPEPVYGYFPWWPEDGDAWLHPEDVALARRTIPGPRVWRREGLSGGWHELHYGAERLRIRPALWCEAPRPRAEIGDLVEILPKGLVHEPHTGVVRDIWWDEHAGELRYRLEVVGRVVDTLYAGEDFKHVSPPSPREEVRIEPSGEEGEELEL